ncbi:MAG: DbpA RNA binding domain-containing protein, partial [Desulfamplus sp.]|nr:DbpA RNA binding domain-containing protein [Desulfamplus sp.]
EKREALNDDDQNVDKEKKEPKKRVRLKDKLKDKDYKPDDKPKDKEKDKNQDKKRLQVAKGMERFKLSVGTTDGVKAGDIVGAIANEAGLEGKFINNITIYDDYTTVDLPEGMPEAIFKLLKKVRILGQKLNIAKLK